MNEILIYGDIGASLAWFDDGITAKGIKEKLAKMSGDVTVRINSAGGDVFEGLAIHNALADHDGVVTVFVDGLAASAASVVAMAGDKVHMADNALMMIHDPWTFAIGNAQELEKITALLEKIKGSIITTYTARTGLTDDVISAWMTDETWFNAQEAVEHGFADVKTADEIRVANTVKPWFKNADSKNVSETRTNKEFYKSSLYKKKLELIKQA